MQTRVEREEAQRVYYVPGSELIPVHSSNISEVPRLRAEHHEKEARRIMLIALTRKIA